MALALVGLLAALSTSSVANAIVADGFQSSIAQSPQSSVSTMALQPHGQVLAGGQFTAADGQKNLALLFEDGTTNTNFKTAEVDGPVMAITLLPNGQILIAGSFTKIRSTSEPVGTGTTRHGIALLGSDGALDSSFNPDATANGAQGNVFRVLRLASGKLLVGGHFTAIGGTPHSKLARLNSDGSVDATFDAGTTNLNDYVWNFSETPDGHILVCGGFTRMGNATHINVARLNADGSNDPTFNASVTYSTSAYPSVNSVLQQSNGSVVITGSFDRVNGAVRTNLARLGTDGSPDSFGNTTVPNGAIHWAVQQPDGSIVIGGSFTSISGQPGYAKLARLTSSSGAIDVTFKPPVISGGDVYTLMRQPDGKILAGGSLTTVAAQPANYVTRVYGTSLLALAGVSRVSGGYFSACMSLTSGETRCTGVFRGDGSTGDFANSTYLSLPVPIDGLGSGAMVAGGGGFTCAVTSAGVAKCWGPNDHGELGDGTTTYRFVPTDVTGLASDVQTIGAGDAHACAASATLGVRCWGDNSHGQLGDGTQIQRLAPVPVVGMASSVQALALGESHTCALTTAGGVKCWGLNSHGQLGDGTTVDRATPVAVVGLSSGVTAITAGISSTCALTAASSVVCWGENTYAQLGDGSLTDRWTPVPIIDIGNDVRMVSAGRYHACVVRFNGQAYCWGNNGDGQLGDGTHFAQTYPTLVVGLDEAVSTIEAGFQSTFATLDSGIAKGWGSNYATILGNGSVGDQNVPTTVNRYAYKVYTSASTGGSISPAGQPLFDAGRPASVSIVPDANYRVVSVDSSCGGSLSGTVFTTDIIGIKCSIAATFGVNTFTVTPSVLGSHGSIAPSTPQTIAGGSSTSFALTPEAGYHATVTGTCGGTLTGNSYATNAITSDCTVIASFVIDTFVVTPSVVGSHGAITPSTAQTVVSGATASFTLAPETGYHATLGGTCGGALAGNVYTTDPISVDCTVVATFDIDMFTVTPSVMGGQGTITPSAPQAVVGGSTTSFTLALDPGYHVSVGGTCTGSLAGNIYTTGAISADCTVIASVAIDTFSVTPSVSGSHGTILPATSQTVAFGSTTSFTVTAETGYHAAVGGTCGGTLLGNVYTTSPISADCSVVASFAIDTFIVTPSVAAGHGTITPSTPQTIAFGGSTTFTLVPESSYLATVSGTCGGSFVANNVYTTDVVTADCTVIASFLRAQASLDISDARDYVRYGTTVDYLVTLVNSGEVPLTGQMAGVMPPQLDGAATTWACIEHDPGVVCVAHGQGALNDYVFLPAGSSVKWLVSAPVRLDAQEPFVDNAVSFSTPTLATPLYATDHDTLVLFRNGVDHDDDDGADGMDRGSQ